MINTVRFLFYFFLRWKRKQNWTHAYKNLQKSILNWFSSSFFFTKKRSLASVKKETHKKWFCTLFINDKKISKQTQWRWQLCVRCSFTQDNSYRETNFVRNALKIIFFVTVIAGFLENIFVLKQQFVLFLAIVRLLYENEDEYLHTSRWGRVYGAHIMHYIFFASSLHMKTNNCTIVCQR